jgi:aryl-alcohol dehydrogenase-like predicted oxidoreductase
MLPVRPLGSTSLSASVLGFGAGHLGGLDDADAARMLHGVLDLGITLIDTAPGYGPSEAMIGRHLGDRRDAFTLVSKCGYGVDGVEDWTPECVTRGVDQALARLRTDRLDVMLFHSCPKEVLGREGLIDALEAAKRAGKVRAIGYSGENEDLEAAIATGRFDVIETSVNMFDQRGISGAVASAAARGMGVIGKRPLGNAPWRFADRPIGQYAEEYWARMKAMGLEPFDMPWGEVALRFAAYQPGVSTVIAGSSRLENMRENAEWVAKGPMGPAVVGKLRRAFEANDRGWVGQI